MEQQSPDRQRFEIEQSVKVGANLSGANLAGAYLKNKEKLVGSRLIFQVGPIGSRDAGTD